MKTFSKELENCNNSRRLFNQIDAIRGITQISSNNNCQAYIFQPLREITFRNCPLHKGVQQSLQPPPHISVTVASYAKRQLGSRDALTSSDGFFSSASFFHLKKYFPKKNSPNNYGFVMIVSISRIFHLRRILVKFFAPKNGHRVLHDEKTFIPHHLISLFPFFQHHLGKMRHLRCQLKLNEEGRAIFTSVEVVTPEAAKVVTDVP